MYIENWDSFFQQAVALYQNNPLKTRFVTKYRHCDGKLTLKVTDDTTVSARGRFGLSSKAAHSGPAGTGVHRPGQWRQWVAAG